MSALADDQHECDVGPTSACVDGLIWPAECAAWPDDCLSHTRPCDCQCHTTEAPAPTHGEQP